MKIREDKSEFEQIKEFIFLCFRHWYYFVISMLICVILAFVYIKVKIPVKMVTAQVGLRHDESLLSGSTVSRSQSLLSAIGLGSNSQNIEDETIKMGSQGYLKKIVRKYDLNFDYKQSVFWGLKKKKLYDQSPLILSTHEAISDTIAPMLFTLNVKKDQTTVTVKYLKKVIGKYKVSAFPSVLETPVGSFTISKSPNYDLYDLPMKIKVFHANYDYMTQIYRKSIEVDFEKKTSDLIQIGMKTENVILAKKILNEIIANYNKEWESDKDLVKERTKEFIDERLRTVNEELLQADLDIQNFKDLHNLTDIIADVEYYLTLSGELQPSLLEAETQLRIIDLIVDFVKDVKNKYAMFPLNPNMTSQAMADVIGKYNEALTKRNEAFTTNNQSPLVQELNERVEVQRETLLKSVENFKKSSQIAVDNLKKKESEIKNQIVKIPSIEKDFLQLKREQELQQTIFIFLLEMREETGVKGVSLLPKLKVIDEPYVINKPLEPNLLKVAITTFFFGGILLPLSLIYGFPLITTYLHRRKEK